MTNPRIAALAEALHEWEDGPASKASELNCYSCATWPDDNTPAFQPKPGDHCYESAAAILAALPPDWCGHEAEIADLNARLADEGYKDGIRLAEAVNEVVLHQRGSIEEAWKYGDEQRALTIKQGRELVAAEAEIARLRRIEEAARALLRWVDDESITLCTICDTERGHFPDCPVPALRAALEEDR